MARLANDHILCFRRHTNRRNCGSADILSIYIYNSRKESFLTSAYPQRLHHYALKHTVRLLFVLVFVTTSLLLEAFVPWISYQYVLLNL
jgi:hypothetical protein